MAILRKFVLAVDDLGRGEMLEVDPDEQVYIPKEDVEYLIQEHASNFAISRRNEADARHSAAEVSQREARWMMIEQRLRTTIAAQTPGLGPDCGCIKCMMARELLAILNSDPPIGDGFQSEQGYSKAGTIVPYNKWNDVNTPGSVVIRDFAQGVESGMKEAANQGGKFPNDVRKG